MSRLTGTLERYRNGEPGNLADFGPLVSGDILAAIAQEQANAAAITALQAPVAALALRVLDVAPERATATLKATYTIVGAVGTKIYFSGADTSWLTWAQAGDNSGTITEPGQYMLHWQARMNYVGSGTTYDFSIKVTPAGFAPTVFYFTRAGDPDPSGYFTDDVTAVFSLTQEQVPALIAFSAVSNGSNSTMFATENPFFAVQLNEQP